MKLLPRASVVTKDHKDKRQSEAAFRMNGVAHLERECDRTQQSPSSDERSRYYENRQEHEP